MVIRHKTVLTIIFVIVCSLSFLTAKVPCFFIEGATGVGKTTFVQLIENNIPNVETIYEPVKTFTDVHGVGNILDLFFGNPHRWTFTTEVYITLMHTKAVEDQAEKSLASCLIVDRSMVTDCYVYGKMAFNSGAMNSIEWEVYKELVSWIMNKTTKKPSGFIYLKTTPEIALERVRLRNRGGEEEVSLQYQEALDSCYQDVFIQKKDIPLELSQVPVLVLDATENFKDNPLIQKQYLEQVKDFIEKINK